MSQYKSTREYFAKNEKFNHLEAKGVDCKLKSVFFVGTRVLLYKNSPQEILSKINDPVALSDKLYVVGKVNNSGSDYIFLSHHLNASTDKKKRYDKKLVASKINCLVEGEDFVVDELGQIKLIRK